MRLKIEDEKKLLSVNQRAETPCKKTNKVKLVSCYTKVYSAAVTNQS